MTTEELKAFLNKHGLSQADLSDLLGVTEMAVSHWMAGNRSISLPMGRLLKLFDKHPELMKEFAA